MKDYNLTEKEINGKTHYYATFIDGQGIEQTTELEKDVYDAINDSQTQISSRARKDRRYGLCSYDETIGESDIIDDSAQTEELLKKVWEHISELTELQQCRLRLYYIEKKTLKQIADMEGAALQSVHESIVSAINNLKAKKYF